MEQKPIYITVYRDGQLSRWETYKPQIRDFIVKTGHNIDFLFINGHWPKHELAER